ETVAGIPILVEQVAETQIGDTRAAEHSESGERRRIGTDSGYRLQPVAAALERRAVMGRAEEQQRAQSLGPLAPRLPRVSNRAARNQPAHAVSENRQPATPARPRLEERLEHARELPSVLRNVTPAVVVHVHGRAAEIARERRA